MTFRWPNNRSGLCLPSAAVVVGRKGSSRLFVQVNGRMEEEEGLRTYFGREGKAEGENVSLPPFIRSPFSLVREREDKNSFLSLPLHPTPLRREATSEACSLQPPLSLLDDGILLPGCSGGQRSNEDTHQQSVGNGKGGKCEYISKLSLWSWRTGGASRVSQTRTDFVQRPAADTKYL